MIRLWVLLCGIVPMVLAQNEPNPGEGGAAVDLPSKVIAVVRDGESPYFDAMVGGFRKELESLASGQYLFEIRDTFNADGDLAAVTDQLKAALADEQVDVVYAAGITASHRAAMLPDAERTKPVVGGAIEFSDFDSGLVKEDGGSTIPNYTFIISPRRVLSDLEQLSDRTEDENVTLSRNLTNLGVMYENGFGVASLRAATRRCRTTSFWNSFCFEPFRDKM